MTVASTNATYAKIQGRLTKPSVTKKGVVYCPGLTGTETSWREGDGVIRNAVEGLTRGGFPVITMDDLVQWGNDTHISRVGSAYTEAQNTLGFNTSKVHLFAASGGSPAVLNWALANLAKVQSIALVIPALDIRGIHTGNLTSTIGLDPGTFGPATAYGGSIPPTTHNPASNAASYAGKPIKIWYSSDDTVCLPAAVTTFAAAAGASTVNLGAVGHNATGLAMDDVRLFFAANDS